MKFEICWYNETELIFSLIIGLVLPRPEYNAVNHILKPIHSKLKNAWSEAWDDLLWFEQIAKCHKLCFLLGFTITVGAGANILEDVFAVFFLYYGWRLRKKAGKDSHVTECLSLARKN